MFSSTPIVAASMATAASASISSGRLSSAVGTSSAAYTFSSNLTHPHSSHYHHQLHQQQLHPPQTHFRSSTDVAAGANGGGCGRLVSQKKKVMVKEAAVSSRSRLEKTAAQKYVASNRCIPISSSATTSTTTSSHSYNPMMMEDSVVSSSSSVLPSSSTSTLNANSYSHSHPTHPPHLPPTLSAVPSSSSSFSHHHHSSFSSSSSNPITTTTRIIIPPSPNPPSTTTTTTTTSTPPPLPPAGIPSSSSSSSPPTSAVIASSRRRLSQKAIALLASNHQLQLAQLKDDSKAVDNAIPSVESMRDMSVNPMVWSWLFAKEALALPDSELLNEKVTWWEIVEKKLTSSLRANSSSNNYSNNNSNSSNSSSNGRHTNSTENSSSAINAMTSTTTHPSSHPHQTKGKTTMTTNANIDDRHEEFSNKKTRNDVTNIKANPLPLMNPTTSLSSNGSKSKCVGRSNQNSENSFLSSPLNISLVSTIDSPSSAVSEVTPSSSSSSFSAVISSAAPALSDIINASFEESSSSHHHLLHKKQQQHQNSNNSCISSSSSPVIISSSSSASFSPPLKNVKLHLSPKTISEAEKALQEHTESYCSRLSIRPRQKPLEENRAEVVNWLSRVGQELKFQSGTVYLAIQHLDGYLCARENSGRPVLLENSKDLELSCTACLFLAAGYREHWYDGEQDTYLKTIVQIRGRIYSCHDVQRKQAEIISLIPEQLASPNTSIDFGLMFLANLRDTHHQELFLGGKLYIFLKNCGQLRFLYDILCSTANCAACHGISLRVPPSRLVGCLFLSVFSDFFAKTSHDDCEWRRLFSYYILHMYYDADLSFWYRLLHRSIRNMITQAPAEQQYSTRLAFWIDIGTVWREMYKHISTPPLLLPSSSILTTTTTTTNPSSSSSVSSTSSHINSNTTNLAVGEAKKGGGGSEGRQQHPSERRSPLLRKIRKCTVPEDMTSNNNNNHHHAGGGGGGASKRERSESTIAYVEGSPLKTRKTPLKEKENEMKQEAAMTSMMTKNNNNNNNALYSTSRIHYVSAIPEYQNPPLSLSSYSTAAVASSCYFKTHTKEMERVMSHG